MGVQKFRNIEDVPPPLPRRTAGENIIAALQLSETCARLRPRRTPRGVFRFGSIEQAQQHRRRWELDGSSEVDRTAG